MLSLYILYTLSIYTLYSLYTLSIYSILFLYIYSILSLYILYTLYIYTLSIYNISIYTLYSLYILSLYSLYTLSIYTLYSFYIYTLSKILSILYTLSIYTLYSLSIYILYTLSILSLYSLYYILYTVYSTQALQEQCLQLQDRLSDLERENSEFHEAAVRQARQASSDSRLGWSYKGGKTRPHAASPSADSVRSMPAQHLYWKQSSISSLEPHQVLCVSLSLADTPTLYCVSFSHWLTHQHSTVSLSHWLTHQHSTVSLSHWLTHQHSTVSLSLADTPTLYCVSLSHWLTHQHSTVGYSFSIYSYTLQVSSAPVEKAADSPWTEVQSAAQLEKTGSILPTSHSAPVAQAVSIETEFPANNGSPKSTRRHLDLDRRPSSESLDSAYGRAFVKYSGEYYTIR